ncbi:MAG: hypothetical protein AB7O45_15940 [Alphaproteobacteria bacterium]
MSVYRFVNERGAEIAVMAAPGPAADEISYAIEGPRSSTTGVLTVMEAGAMAMALRAAIDDPTGA